MCQTACPYQAIEREEIKDRNGNVLKTVAKVNPGLCQDAERVLLSAVPNLSIYKVIQTSKSMLKLCFAEHLKKRKQVMNENKSEFEPKIVAFVCNWCTYAGADLTGTSRLKYATNVEIVRFPCTGRIDFMLLLKAFAGGADGIIVSGCHPNDCHYTSGNFHARRRWMVFRGLLDFLGIDVRRICYSWVSAAEGAKWAELVNTTVADIRELGPYEEYKKVAGYLEQEVAYE